MAQEAKAWGCSMCSKTYPYNEWGKLQAESCCTCRRCQTTLYTSRTSRHNLCRKCSAEVDEEGVIG